MKCITSGYSRLVACRACFAIFLVLCTCGPALAQNTYTGLDLLFEQQADLDAFENGAKYTSTNGSITLNGNNTVDPITDLS